MRAIPRPDGPLNVNIGSAEYGKTDETIVALPARADQAVRQAKREGRNRIANVSVD